MIFRYLTTVLALMFLAGIATAGLDGDRRFDRVVAVYHFENTEDSGPREFDGVFTGNAAIIDDGKVDANGGHYNRKTGGYHYHGGGTSQSRVNVSPVVPNSLGSTEIDTRLAVRTNSTVKVSRRSELRLAA